MDNIITILMNNLKKCECTNNLCSCKNIKVSLMVKKKKAKIQKSLCRFCLVKNEDKVFTCKHCSWTFHECCVLRNVMINPTKSRKCAQCNKRDFSSFTIPKIEGIEEDNSEDEFEDSMEDIDEVLVYATNPMNSPVLDSPIRSHLFGANHSLSNQFGLNPEPQVISPIRQENHPMSLADTFEFVKGKITDLIAAQLHGDSDVSHLFQDMDLLHALRDIGISADFLVKKYQ
jgi:hypothetical protein